ncbi:recombinase RecA [Candidatus Bipolaricaulota bacterium]|nr:recombinase RecA [Candidatus Bipolaricaulota bacterium]
MGKEEVLNSTLERIKKDHGEGSIMWMGDEKVLEVDVIPSGSLALDIALGAGGVPRGRIVEIFGKESSGKTTLALHMLAEVHNNDGAAAFVDAEHALDPKYSSQIGIDLDRLLLSQPNSGEEALEITEKLIRSGALDMVVIDSVAALVPQAELEGEMGDSQVGLQARLMSQAMRKLAGAISQSRTTVVFTNQIRSKINNSPWGPSTTTSGGRALKFYSSLRLNIYITKTLDKDGEKVGNAITVKVVKNKVAPPFKEANFDIIYGEGISRPRELINLGEEYDIVERSGSWYSYGDTRLGQGVDNSEEFLKENEEVADEIEEKIRQAAGLSADEPEEDSDGEEEESEESEE